MTDLARTIDDAFEARDGIGPSTQGPVRAAVDEALAMLDSGKMRVAENRETAAGT
jgi:2,3,4,5-tetrahydropyridine-2-carboxylate N-succinyltransferase